MGCWGAGNKPLAETMLTPFLCRHVLLCFNELMTSKVKFNGKFEMYTEVGICLNRNTNWCIVYVSWLQWTDTGQNRIDDICQRGLLCFILLVLYYGFFVDSSDSLTHVPRAYSALVWEILKWSTRKIQDFLINFSTPCLYPELNMVIHTRYTTYKSPFT